MSFEADLKSHLQTAVGAVLIYPLKLKDGVTKPAITYTIIYGEPQNSLDWFTSGVTRNVVQLVCWAESFDVAVSLGTLVFNQMNTPHTNFTSSIPQYPSFDEYEEETKRYRRSITCNCLFKS